MDKQLILYTVPGCPLCRDARQILNDRGLSYTEKDVANDYSSLRRMYRLTRQGLVPVFEYDGKAAVRPSSEELDRLLRAKQAD